MKKESSRPDADLLLSFLFGHSTGLGRTMPRRPPANMMAGSTTVSDGGAEMELITAREIITGLITLAMYEFFFRPLIFKTGIKRSNKKEICD